MDEVLPTALAVLGCTVILTVVAAQYRNDETSWLMGSWLAHLVAVAAQFYVNFTIYRGDALGYGRRGIMLGELVGWDRLEMLKVGLALLFQQEGPLPFAFQGAGAPTGSMSGVSLLLLVFTGSAVYAPVVLLALGSCLGKIAIYQAFRDTFPPHLHLRLLLATCYLPSVLFWSSGLLKEAVVVVVLGPFVLGLQRALDGRLQWLGVVALSAVIIALLKPHIVVALVVACAAMIYARRTRTLSSGFSPFGVALGTFVAIGGMITVGRVFPELSSEEIMESIAQERSNYTGRGGSSITAFDPTRMGPFGQFAAAPLALFTAWFRPLLIEAHNPQATANALESTLFLVLAGRVVWRNPLGEMARRVVSEPLLMFSLAFAFTLGLGVGLTTPNLGSLSRYRMPLLPFLMAFLVVLSARQSAPAVVAAMGLRALTRPTTPTLVGGPQPAGFAASPPGPRDSGGSPAGSASVAPQNWK